MATRSPGRIYIGGDVPLALVPSLKEAMEVPKEEDILREFEGQEEQDYGIMAPPCRFSGTLCVYDVYACDGEFPELVDVCKANNLPFVMESDYSDEYESVITWWTPQMAAPDATMASNQGEPFTDTREALKLIDELLELAKAGELESEEERQSARLAITGRLKMPPTTLTPFTIGAYPWLTTK